MRILLIHQAFVSPNEAGGTRHFEFGQHLLKNGHDFTIVASDLNYLTGGKASNTQGLLSQEEIQGVEVIRAYTYKALHKSFLWRVVSFISFMFTSLIAGLKAGPVDLVMGTSPPIFQAFSAWAVAAVRRRPFLLEVRDLWPEFAVDMGVLKNPILIKLAKALESFLYWRADHILVNSPAYRDYMLRKGLPASKVSLISNGVDPNMFDPAADGANIRKEFHLNGQFVATYAGALGLANDIPTILKAAAEIKHDHPNIKILLVGDGKESSRLKDMAAKLELSNVIFTGARPKSQMREILAASNACIATLQDIPMFRTTYPNKVFDYMAAGRPTVLGIDGVIRKVIEDAEGGLFVPPGNPTALAEAILRLAKDPQKAELMGRSARTFVVQHFNRAHHAEEFLKLVQQVTTSK